MVRELDPGFSAQTQTFWWFANDGDRKLFIDGVRKAGLPVCAEHSYLKASPDVPPLEECSMARSAS
jgi:hypothetical protein